MSRAWWSVLSFVSLTTVFASFRTKQTVILVCGRQLSSWELRGLDVVRSGYKQCARWITLLPQAKKSLGKIATRCASKFGSLVGDHFDLSKKKLKCRGFGTGRKELNNCGVTVGEQQMERRGREGSGRIQNNRLSCWLLTVVARATVAVWVWLIVVVQVHRLGGRKIWHRLRTIAIFNIQKKPNIWCLNSGSPWAPFES